MLGPRVNALSLGGLLRRLRRRRRSRADRRPRAGSGSPTGSCAARSPCSSRPWPSCSSPAAPFLRLQQGVPGAEVYPPGVESRDAYVALQTEFAPGETTPDRHPGRRRRARRRTLRPSGRSPTTPTGSTALDGIDRVEGPFTIRNPQTGVAADARRGRRALRAARRPATGRASTRCSQQYVRESTVRLDAISPIPPAEPGGDRPDPAGPRRSTPGRRHHDPGRRQRGDRLRLPGLAGRARAVGRRADPGRQRRDPVPAVRLGGPAAQGGHHDPALDQRQLRRPRLDLPGRQPGGPPRLRAARATPSPATRSSCSACSSGCRWTTRSCSCRGSRRPTGGPATTGPRSPRASPGRPA